MTGILSKNGEEAGSELDTELTMYVAVTRHG